MTKNLIPVSGCVCVLVRAPAGGGTWGSNLTFWGVWNDIFILLVGLLVFSYFLLNIFFSSAFVKFCDPTNHHHHHPAPPISQIWYNHLINMQPGSNFVAFNNCTLPSLAPSLSPCHEDETAGPATCRNALNQSECILYTYATCVKHRWALRNPQKPILHRVVF